ncbi:hypothetical protein [Enterococcus sp. AZ177]|uniref:hypothetical protein n=1 Tax=unclassified Enterococcus TaxID=2608891 RepID=UPI003D2FD9FD
MKKVLIHVLSCSFLIGSAVIPIANVALANEKEVIQEIRPDSDASILSDEGAGYLDVPEINLDDDFKEYETDVSSPQARAAFLITWKIESKKRLEHRMVRGEKVRLEKGKRRYLLII